ncbi:MULTISPECIES: EamA family transporter [Acidithiobacillus]|uniref:EamA family transporter n=1 Tax=Acidithiobacillus TaxID=119977 RepID=UPI000AC6DE3F|nr:MULTISPECIES: EamA family transporter [Acidithiobacillus]
MWRKQDQLWECLGGWRVAWSVGILSALGSWAWFSAFALTQVALVRGLGQIDTLLVFLFGHHVLKERFGRVEIIATLLIVIGAICIVAPDIC